MEFGLDQLRTGLRPDSSRLELLEPDRRRFEAKFHYTILVADRSESGRRPVTDLLARAATR